MVLLLDRRSEAARAMPCKSWRGSSCGLEVVVVAIVGWCHLSGSRVASSPREGARHDTGDTVVSTMVVVVVVVMGMVMVMMCGLLGITSPPGDVRFRRSARWA